MLALNQEIKTDDEGHRVLEDFTDFTEPQVKQIEKKAGRIMKEFMQLVYPHGYDPAIGVAKKRAFAPRDAPAAKRGPAVAAGTGPAAITQAAEEGTLKKYTVAQLKDVSA